MLKRLVKRFEDFLILLLLLIIDVEEISVSSFIIFYSSCLDFRIESTESVTDRAKVSFWKEMDVYKGGNLLPVKQPCKQGSFLRYKVIISAACIARFADF